MVSRPWWALLVAMLCALLSVSCCVTPCIRGIRGTPPTPAPTVPISGDAAERYEQKATELAAEEFRVEFTEEEITSYVALQLKDVLPITSPQIRFLPGKLVLEGDVTSPVKGHLSLSGTIVVTDGRPEIKFAEATIGGIPVPGSLLASVSDTISDSIGIGEGNVEIEQIELAQGRIIIAGRKRP